MNPYAALTHSGPDPDDVALVGPSDRFGAVTLPKPDLVITSLFVVLAAAWAAFGADVARTPLTAVAAVVLCLAAAVAPLVLEVLVMKLLGGDDVRLRWLSTPDAALETGHVFLGAARPLPRAGLTFRGDRRHDRRTRFVVLVPAAGIVVSLSVLASLSPPTGSPPPDRWWVASLLALFTGGALALLMTLPTLGHYRGPKLDLPQPSTSREVADSFSAAIPQDQRRPGAPGVRRLTVAALDRWSQQMADPHSRLDVELALMLQTRSQRRRVVVSATTAFLGIGPELLRDMLDTCVDPDAAQNDVGACVLALQQLLDDDPDACLRTLEPLLAPRPVNLIRTAAQIAAGDLAAARRGLEKELPALAARHDPYLALARQAGLGPAWADRLFADLARGDTEEPDVLSAVVVLDPDRAVTWASSACTDLVANQAVAGLTVAADSARLSVWLPWIDRVAVDPSAAPFLRDSAGLALIELGRGEEGHAILAELGETAGDPSYRAIRDAVISGVVPENLRALRLRPWDPLSRRLLVRALRT